MDLHSCQLTTYQLWDLKFKFVSILAIFGGAFKYLNDRKYAVSQYNSKFIHELGITFDNNPNHQEANKMIEITSRNHPFRQETELESAIKKWETPELGPLLNDSEYDILFKIDRYLDFFDRIYHYVFVTKALKPQDAECFRWYLSKIVETKCVNNYAVNNGYEDVIKLHNSLEEFERKKESKVIEGSALKVAGSFFCLFAIIHILRIFLGIEIKVGVYFIPLWISAIAAVFGLMLSWWMFKSAE